MVKVPERKKQVGASSGRLSEPDRPPLELDPVVLGRQLQEVAAILETPEGRRLYRMNPEFREVCERLYEDAQRLMEFIDFAMTGDRVAPRYRITADSFWDLVMAQGWACPLCRVVFEPGGTKMVVDHNHASGAVRGVLCMSCNTGLGHLKDSPDVLERAIEYLETRGCYGPDALSGDR